MRSLDVSSLHRKPLDRDCPQRRKRRKPNTNIERPDDRLIIRAQHKRQGVRRRNITNPQRANTSKPGDRPAIQPKRRRRHSQLTSQLILKHILRDKIKQRAREGLHKGHQGSARGDIRGRKRCLRDDNGQSHSHADADSEY